MHQELPHRRKRFRHAAVVGKHEQEVRLRPHRHLQQFDLQLRQFQQTIPRAQRIRRVKIYLVPFC